MATDEDYLETVTFMRQQGMDDNEIRQAYPELVEALDRLNSEARTCGLSQPLEAPARLCARRDPSCRCKRQPSLSAPSSHLF